jgi:signal transduction histidine kinase
MAQRDLPDDPLAEMKEGFSSKSWATRHDSVRKASDLLRTVPDASVVEEVAQALNTLSRDAKWEVRNAVAFAVQYLNHPLFDKIIGTLIDDTNDYVRSTAEKTFKMRRSLSRLVERQHEEMGSVLDQINRLKSRYPADLADHAIRIGQRYFFGLAAETSHEVKGVLTSLKRTLERLEKSLKQRKVPKKAWEADLTRALGRCDFIEKIVQDIKSYAEETKPEFQKVNILETVTEAINIVKDGYKKSAKAPNVQLEVFIDKHLVIDAPRHHLIQVFTNVIKNAYEAIKRKGNISINANATEKGNMVIRFIDNGCGMTDETRRDAFLPFATTKDGHTGFGLSFVQKIIERECHGDIRIESGESAGTTVIITLPIEQTFEDFD